MAYFAALRRSLTRVGAIIAKEVLPMRRDRTTLSLMFGLPLLELLLFGFAINTDPHNLPTAVLSADQTRISRTVLSALANTGYMEFTHRPETEDEANQLLQRGDVQFIVRVPSEFTRRLVRGERAQVLIDADATDPVTMANSLAAAGPAVTRALKHDFVGPLETWASRDDPVELVLHRRYNPEGKERLNIVPGLLAVILSVGMVLMTALAVTREREQGTMETLLATPARPIEVMIGTIVPYFVVGAIYTAMILVLSWLLFDITVEGSLAVLLLGAALFITANLAVGFTVSTLTKNQLQAMQVSFFFLLPSILLSGFMFPFRGMPRWAQYIGDVLPLTHFLRIVRGILLKGNGLVEIAPELWPIALFAVVALAVGIKRYRQTLD